MRQLIASLLFLVAGAGTGAAGANERIVGLPCEGCEAVFEGMPASVPSRARIGRTGEPGEPMRVTGTVTDDHGRPARNVVVYAYQTNARASIRRRAATPGAPRIATACCAGGR